MKCFSPESLQNRKGFLISKKIFPCCFVSIFQLKVASPLQNILGRGILRRGQQGKAVPVEAEIYVETGELLDLFPAFPQPFSIGSFLDLCLFCKRGSGIPGSKKVKQPGTNSGRKMGWERDRYFLPCCKLPQRRDTSQGKNNCQINVYKHLITTFSFILKDRGKQ